MNLALDPAAGSLSEPVEAVAEAVAEQEQQPVAEAGSGLADAAEAVVDVVTEGGGILDAVSELFSIFD